MIDKYPCATIDKNIIYSEFEGVQLTFDMIYKTKKALQKRPAIVFLHGGGFRAGEPSQFHAIASYFANKFDIFSVSVKYRLTPYIKWPGNLLDVKKAIQWLRENYGEYSIDTEKIIACGGSAGGYLALMSVLDVPAAKDFEELNPTVSRANAAVLLNGIIDGMATYNNTPVAKEVFDLLMGGTVDELPEDYHNASPVNLFDENVPPVLMMQGAEDDIAPYKDTISAYEKLISLGTTAEICIFPGQGHGWFNAAENQPPVFDKIESFLQTIGFIERKL